jgi:hypothetical protein
VCVRRRAPAPSQSAHGLEITEPCPPHVPQVLAMAKKPCWKRICPEPRHCEHTAGLVPGFAPLPPHVAQGVRRGIDRVFSKPRAASSKVTSS